MADEGGSQKGLVAVIIVLVVALLVVFYLWQQDQESKDVRIDFDTGDAGTLVAPGSPVALTLPDGVVVTRS